MGQSLSLDQHVNSLVCLCFYQLNITERRSIVSTAIPVWQVMKWNAAAKLQNLVIHRVSCNSNLHFLYTGFPSNSESRFISSGSEPCRVGTILKSCCSHLMAAESGPLIRVCWLFLTRGSKKMEMLLRSCHLNFGTISHWNVDSLIKQQKVSLGFCFCLASFYLVVFDSI